MCLLDDQIGQIAKFLQKGAFGGPFYQKGVVARFKKVKCITFKTHWSPMGENGYPGNLVT